MQEHKIQYSALFFDNIRLVVSEARELLEKDNYYAFEMTIDSLSYTQTEPENRYKYNGKELFSDLQWLNYGARFYDAAVSRWWDFFNEK